MVNVARGAGTSLSIKGTMDTQGIEQGFGRVKSGFKSVKGQSEGFNSDLVRMGSATGALVKKLGTLAAAGGTAMVALASKSPAVAPALAKMGVEFDRLSRSLGRALKPAFESASDAFGDFVSWIDRNEDKIKSFSTNVVSGLETTLSGVGATWEGLVDSADVISKTLNISTGMKGDLTELFGSAGSAAIIGKLLGMSPLKAGGLGAGLWGVGVSQEEDASSGRKTLGGAAIGAGVGSMFGPWGAVAGGVFGGAGGWLSENTDIANYNPFNPFTNTSKLNPANWINKEQDRSLLVRNSDGYVVV